MEFVKMQGLGNDFILIEEQGLDFPGLARRMCDRHFGVGADGLIVVDRGNGREVGMTIYNSDGSQAEMCGNGIRCLARYVYEKGMVSDPVFPVRTGAGIITPEVLVSGGTIGAVRVDMGVPSFVPVEVSFDDRGLQAEAGQYQLEIGHRSFQVTPVSMGNPHAVLFEIPDNWMVYGATIENHPRFTRRTNVEFVRIVNSREAEVKVWERGAGATLACGTGACAVLAASAACGVLDRKASIHLPGGTLAIEWPDDHHSILMEGPAEYVFSGTFNL